METVGAKDLAGSSAISSEYHPSSRIGEISEGKGRQALGRACEAGGEGTWAYSEISVHRPHVSQQGCALRLPSVRQHLWNSSARGPGGRHQQCHLLPPGQGVGLQVLSGTVAGEDEGITVMGTRGQGLRLAVPSLQGRPCAAS